MHCYGKNIHAATDHDHCKHEYHWIASVLHYLIIINKNIKILCQHITKQQLIWIFIDIYMNLDKDNNV